MNIFKSAAIVLALAASPAVNAQPTTISTRGSECTTCHVDGKLTPPDAKTCLACHREESIVKAGERFNFESYFKDPRDGSESAKEVAINPHDNFHYGRTDQCVNCHREHRPEHRHLRKVPRHRTLEDEGAALSVLSTYSAT